MNAVLVMYEGAQTVRTTEGDSKAFDVKVGLHQGSVLSPLLFATVMKKETQLSLTNRATRLEIYNLRKIL